MNEQHSSTPYYDKNERKYVTRGNLPHWSQERKIYAVTFRLCDAIPINMVKRYFFEQGQCEDDTQRVQQEIAFHKKMMEYLDAGYGECLLRNIAVRNIIEKALGHISKHSAYVYAYVIMPNHVHILLETYMGVTVQKVMHSLKRYTSAQINRLLHRKGRLWQREFFDRIIRSDEHFAHAIAYIKENPRYCSKEEFSLWIAEELK